VDPPRRDGGGAANSTNLTGAMRNPPRPAGEPRLERQGSSLAGTGDLLSMASVWRSIFDSCETAGALALVEGWVTLEAVQGAASSLDAFQPWWCCRLPCDPWMLGKPARCTCRMGAPLGQQTPGSVRANGAAAWCTAGAASQQ